MTAPAELAGPGQGDSPWPAEPYPGLRPFLEREAALLFGRQRQIREVIERLRLTQFVAVLGGSGSGKSSLIHAGVTPELRSHGILAAGDLWLPTVCTPGTNVSAEDRLARRHTPVVRLARRFAELLKSRGSAQADADRIDAIAAVFRQEGGFTRLLDVYGPELALEPGLKPEDARVLFVLDQFEEVFHPTNADVEDARALVERTLDHFFSPHPRCYVVLTMRSEHLNDCAGYLELPDAINKSSYLVRRLDADELREAIVGPTEHFLRLMQLKRQRDEDSGVETSDLPPLPAQVQFDAEVIARLLKDVGAITHDPDHLPLLQHLLARLWQVAQAREAQQLQQARPGLPGLKSSAVVPGRITPADLHGAVSAERAPRMPLGEDNTLRTAVDAWPNAVMRKCSAAERSAVDEVLRRLALKDPKTGMYSQQRLRVHGEAARILGPGKTADDLYAMLQARFLSSVNYLFWDRRDADNVTLKVSHEALIRGWGHFQRLVDAEFQHYETFVAALRRCADWLDNGQHAEALLRPLELARLREGGLGERLARPELRAMWLRQLKRERDAQRLASVEPALDDFLQRSFEEERQQQQRLQDAESQRVVLLRARRRRRFQFAVSMVALPWLIIVGTVALYAKLVQEPITSRLALALKAGNQANSAPLSQVQPAVHGDESTLRALRQAVLDVAQARDDTLPLAGGLPGVADQEIFVRSVAHQVEPAVNGQLRRLLTTAVWAALPPEDALRLPEPLVLPDARCRLQSGSAMGRGQLIVQQFGFDRAEGATPASSPAATRWRSQPRRALFWLNPRGQDVMALHAASADADGQNCSYGPALVRIPWVLGPKAVVDSELRLLIYGVAGEAGGDTSAAVTVLGIEWERDAQGHNRLKQSATRSVVVDDDSQAFVPFVAPMPEALARTGSAALASATSSAAAASQAVAAAQRGSVVAQVARAAGTSGLGALPTWRVAGGRVLALDSQVHWRVALGTADRLRLAAPEGEAPALSALGRHQQAIVAGLRPLTPAGQDSVCANLKREVAWLQPRAGEPGVRTELYAAPGHCFVLTRRDDAPQAAAAPLDGDGAAAGADDPGGGTVAPAAVRRWQTVSVAVFAQPPVAAERRLALGSPVPIASLSHFARVRADWADWQIGLSGPCAGWLLLKTRASSNGGGSYLAAPWSSAALAGLGREILSLQSDPLASGGCVLPRTGS